MAIPPVISAMLAAVFMSIMVYPLAVGVAQEWLGPGWVWKTQRGSLRVKCGLSLVHYNASSWGGRKAVPARSVLAALTCYAAPRLRNLETIEKYIEPKKIRTLAPTTEYFSTSVPSLEGNGFRVSHVLFISSKADSAARISS